MMLNLPKKIKYRINKFWKVITLKKRSLLITIIKDGCGSNFHGFAYLLNVIILKN